MRFNMKRHEEPNISICESPTGLRVREKDHPRFCIYWMGTSRVVRCRATLQGWTFCIFLFQFVSLSRQVRKLRVLKRVIQFFKCLWLGSSCRSSWSSEIQKRFTFVLFSLVWPEDTIQIILRFPLSLNDTFLSTLLNQPPTPASRGCPVGNYLTIDLRIRYLMSQLWQQGQHISILLPRGFYSARREPQKCDNTLIFYQKHTSLLK